MEREALKKILLVCKKTEGFINEEGVIKSADKAVANDIIKAKKAMAYEDILEIIKKYAKTQKK